MLRRILFLGLLSLLLNGQTNPYRDWDAWADHYPEYLRQSAKYWVQDRTSQIILGSWLIALPVLLKTDNKSSLAIHDAGILGSNGQQFGEAWGRFIGPAYLLSLTALQTFRPHLSRVERYQRLEYVITTYGVAGTLTSSLKFLARRERPDGTDSFSFPSGHTTLAFATAEITRQLYGNWWGGAAYGLAVLTGIQRVQDQRHWVGDVVTAAVLSTTIARALAPGKTRAARLHLGVSQLNTSQTLLVTLSREIPFF